MKKVYETVKTPYKYGLVLVPERDEDMVDSPTVFREKGKWYMTYVLFDSTGYETWLAESDDLLKWNTLGPILSFAGGSWDSAQRGGYLALQDYRWGGSYRAGKYDGRYWLSYIGGATQGYEAGMLNVGMARTGGKIARPHEWEGFDDPGHDARRSGRRAMGALHAVQKFGDPGPETAARRPVRHVLQCQRKRGRQRKYRDRVVGRHETWRRYSDRPVLNIPKGSPETRRSRRWATCTSCSTSAHSGKENRMRLSTVSPVRTIWSTGRTGRATI